LNLYLRPLPLIFYIFDIYHLTMPLICACQLDLWLGYPILFNSHLIFIYIFLIADHWYLGYLILIIIYFNLVIIVIYLFIYYFIIQFGFNTFYTFIHIFINWSAILVDNFDVTYIHDMVSGLPDTIILLNFIILFYH